LAEVFALSLLNYNVAYYIYKKVSLSRHVPDEQNNSEHISTQNHHFDFLQITYSIISVQTYK